MNNIPKKRKGSSKGSCFEREICKKLSMWWSNNERDDIFWRSAGSGAMAKTRSKKNKTTFGQYGDIQATDPIGQPLLNKVSIELKCGYSKYTFYDLLDKPTTAAIQKINEFIEQASTDATNSGAKDFLLIMKRTRREIMCLTTHNIKSQIGEISEYINSRVLLKNGTYMDIFICKLDFILSNSFLNNMKNEV